MPPRPPRTEQPAPDTLPLPMRILDLFAQDPPRLSIYPADAESLLPGASKAAVYRECRALSLAGWLEAIDGAGETAYRLGPKAHAMLRRAIECSALQVDLLSRVCDDARRLLRAVEAQVRTAVSPRNGLTDVDDDTLGSELGAHREMAVLA